jgi:hypothetical protein
MREGESQTEPNVAREMELAHLVKDRKKGTGPKKGDAAHLAY